MLREEALLLASPEQLRMDASAVVHFLQVPLLEKQMVVSADIIAKDISLYSNKTAVSLLVCVCNRLVKIQMNLV